MLELQHLNNKLDLLIRKCASVQAENKKLQRAINDQNKNIELLKSKLSGVEQDRALAQVGGLIANQNGNSSMEKDLDNIIKEIDLILTTLDA